MEIKTFDNLDYIFYHIFRLRNYFLDLITYFSKNEKEKMSVLIKQILDHISNLNKKSQIKTNLFDNNIQNINIPFSEFNKILELKNEELLEFNKISYLNLSNLFVNQTCFLLFQKKFNETMIDLIKEDNSNQIEKNFIYFDLKKLCDNKNFEAFDNKYYESLKIILYEKIKEFEKLNCFVVKKDFKFSNQNLIKIVIQMKIENAFQIYLEILFDYQNTYFYNIEVFGENELFNIINPFITYKKNIKNMLVKEIAYKDINLNINKNKTHQSKYLLFKKLSTIFKDKLTFIIDHKKKLHLNASRNDQNYLIKSILESILIFLNYISRYNNLFKKKCLYCNQISKYNKYEKNFYPPYYKFFDLDKDKEHFYHEECYFFLNNKSL